MIRLLSILLLSMFLGTSVYASANDEWVEESAKTIVSKVSYPRSALAKEEEGRAVVLVTVNADGTIASHKIMQRTGVKTLDNVIPRILERVGKLEPTPSGDKQNVVVPMVWQLS